MTSLPYSSHERPVGRIGGRVSFFRATGETARSPEPVERHVERPTFKKKDRITAKGDFDRLRRSGIRLADGTLAVVILPTLNGFSRLGISVPKRIGGAVVRNRLKRLIREVFRLHRDGLPSSADLLVIVRKMPERMTYGELSDRILSLVKRYHGPDEEEGSVRGPEAG